MPLTLWPLLWILLAYLIGGIPWGLLLVRAFKGIDIRTVGSGNIGATNAFRAGGRPIGFLTLALDFLKGFVPTWLGLLWFGSTWGLGAGIAAILGHTFPIYLGFRGGKGVATGAGVLLALSPWAFVAAGLVWFLVTWLVGYVSLASMLAAATAAVVVWLTPATLLLRGILAVTAVLIIARHHSNIRRLIQGQEPKVGWRLRK